MNGLRLVGLMNGVHAARLTLCAARLPTAVRDPGCSLPNLMQAINHVLYERHGYRRQRRHGDPRE